MVNIIAYILAAGFSSRISKIANGRPKTLLQVCKDKTVLDQILCGLKEVKCDCVIIANDRNNKEFTQNFKVIINKIPELNNFYTVYIAFKDAIKKERNAIIVNSDVVAPLNFYVKLKREILKDGSEAIALVSKHKLGEEEMKVRVIEGKIARISKKLNPSNAHGEYIGIAYIPIKFMKEYIRKTEELLKKEIKGIYYEDVWDMLLKDGKVVIRPLFVHGKWTEIDTKEDYKYAIKIVSENEKAYF